MGDRTSHPLWIDLAVAFVAPWFAVLPARHADLPVERRKSVRWALILGAVTWVAVLASVFA
jgi:hypothetical protein